MHSKKADSSDEPTVNAHQTSASSAEPVAGHDQSSAANGEPTVEIHEHFPAEFFYPKQPPLPEHIPAWITHLVHEARKGGIHQKLSDRAQQTPPTSKDGKAIRPSAVLILLSGDPTFRPTEQHPYPEGATLLLTHRAPTLSSHSGQMAFPGGRKDEEDHTPIATALREATEETGLDPQSVEPLAVLPPIYIDRTHNVVTPVLAYWRTPGEVHAASPTEVASVKNVPLDTLTNPENRISVGIMGWTGPAFHIGKLILWGFTGGIVDALLKEAGWEQPWDRSTVYDLAEVLDQSENNEPTALWTTDRQ